MSETYVGLFLQIKGFFHVIDSAAVCYCLVSRSCLLAKLREVGFALYKSINAKPHPGPIQLINLLQFAVCSNTCIFASIKGLFLERGNFFKKATLLHNILYASCLFQPLHTLTFSKPLFTGMWATHGHPTCKLAQFQPSD